MLFYTVTFKTKNGDSEGKIRLMNQACFHPFTSFIQNKS